MKARRALPIAIGTVAAVVVVVALVLAGSFFSTEGPSITSSSTSTRATNTTSTPTTTSAAASITSYSASSSVGCGGTSVGLVPLTDLGNGTFVGYRGGLYPNGSNMIPAAHLAEGLALAKQVVPRDWNGAPSPNGKIVLLSIGMSNAAIEFSAFMQAVSSDGALNQNLVLVNGAQGGKSTNVIVNPNDNFWSVVDSRLTSSEVTRQQVQAVWMKEEDPGPTGSPVAHAQTIESEYQTVLHILTQRFPNLKLAYLSSRVYAGYAKSSLNPEPYAYASGFAVKWLIESQINGSTSLNYNASGGTVVAPWVSWGPYLWADGLKPRGDGVTWNCSDFASDGTHPSTQGARKVANIMLTFFSTDPTAKLWFLNA